METVQINVNLLRMQNNVHCDPVSVFLNDKVLRRTRNRMAAVKHDSINSHSNDITEPTVSAFNKIRVGRYDKEETGV